MNKVRSRTSFVWAFFQKGIFNKSYKSLLIAFRYKNRHNLAHLFSSPSFFFFFSFYLWHNLWMSKIILGIFVTKYKRRSVTKKIIAINQFQSWWSQVHNETWKMSKILCYFCFIDELHKYHKTPYIHLFTSLDVINNKHWKITKGK